MRSELFERLRRIAERTHDATIAVNGKSKYDPAQPWATVFAMAFGEETKTWWDHNLHRDALLFLTIVRSAAAITDDGAFQPALDAPASVRPADVSHNSASGESPVFLKPAPKQKPHKPSAPAPPAQSAQSEQMVTGYVYSRDGKMFCNF